MAAIEFLFRRLFDQNDDNPVERKFKDPAELFRKAREAKR